MALRHLWLEWKLLKLRIFADLQLNKSETFYNIVFKNGGRTADEQEYEVT